MNILIDIRPLMDERYSGVAEYTFELLQALFARDTDNHYILWYNSGRDISGRMPVFDYANVRVVRSRFPNKLLNYGLLKLWRRPRLDRLVKEAVDVFFMPHLNFAAVSSSVQSVVTVHDLSFLLFPHFFNWRKNVWHSLIGVKKMVRRFDRVVTMSQNTVADIVALTGIDPCKISIIPAGVSDAFRPISADDENMSRVKQKYHLPDQYILFLGTVEPRKNIEGVIEAFNAIKEHARYEALELVIAGGRGWKAQPIYRLAKESSHRAHIHFLDYVDKEDKVYVYNGAKLFAYPSFYEGFGFPPLEAMACGIPAIVATSASLPEVTGNAAVLVDPYNAQALALAMQEILDNSELAASLSEAGITKARQFGWAKAADAYLTMFNNMYAGKS